jgi:hypothetical protein
VHDEQVRLLSVNAAAERALALVIDLWRRTCAGLFRK